MKMRWINHCCVPRNTCCMIRNRTLVLSENLHLQQHKCSINTANYCGAMLHCSTTMCSTINSVPDFLEFQNTVSQFTPCKWTCLCFPHLSSCICALWATRFALWLVFWKVGTYCAIFLQVLFAKLHWLSSSSSS